MDQQQGFRKARGTTDGIFMVKQVHQIAEKMRKPVYALFVDLSAAFDHVCRKWMFISISNRNAIEYLKRYTNTLQQR